MFENDWMYGFYYCVWGCGVDGVYFFFVWGIIVIDYFCWRWGSWLWWYGGFEMVEFVDWLGWLYCFVGL